MKQRLASSNWFLAAAVLIFALILRLPLLNGSFWLDEAAQALESSRPLAQQLDIAYDFQPPLLHLILHFALFVSKEESWLRTVGALIPGLVSLAATYAIGRQLFNQKIALLTTLLLATNSFHIFYSQELRPYALPLMLACLSWLALLRWLTAHKKVRPLLLYTMFTLLGLYSSYLYPFLALSQTTFVLLAYRSNFTQYARSAIWAVVLFLPWLPSLVGQLQVSSELRAQLPSWEKVVSIEAVRSVALVLGKSMFGVINLDFTLLFAICAGIALFFLCFGVARTALVMYKSKKNPPTLSIVLWLVVPLLTAWMVSLIVPILHPKRVLYLLPAFYFVITTTIEKYVPSRLRFLAYGFFLLVNIFGMYKYYTDATLQREDWRGLHVEIRRAYPSDSIVLFSFPEPFAPWIWYDQYSYPASASGTLALKDADMANFLQPVDEYTYILVFDYLRTLTDPDNILGTELNKRGFTESNYLDQPNIGFVRIYTQPSKESTL